MSSESDISATEMQSFLERLISSTNRDISTFLPLMLAFSGPDPSQTRSNSGENSDQNSANQTTPEERRERIVMINPLTQPMVVIEGTGFDTLFHGVESKGGQPPASKSAIEGMPSVEIREGEEKECVICLEDCGAGSVVKEMPCKHRFHCKCIDKWLGIHGSCPVCRFKMPVEEEDGGKKREEERDERREQREIRVSFLFGRNRRRTEEEEEESELPNIMF